MQVENAYGLLHQEEEGMLILSYWVPAPQLFLQQSLVDLWLVHLLLGLFTFFLEINDEALKGKQILSIDST